MSTLEFQKLICGNIFKHGFNPFEKNNTISFSDRGIAVVYAPNGTGKTTLMKTLNGEKGSSFSLKYEHAEYENNSAGLFYVISDQTDRNIIQGTTRDFFLGEDIQREFALKDTIEGNRKVIIDNIISLLKTKYKISSGSSQLIKKITDPVIASFVGKVANSKNKAQSYSDEDLIQLFANIIKEESPEYDPAKMQFLFEDISGKNSIIIRILQLTATDISKNECINQIEENTEAIRVLQKFKDLHYCVVCDNDEIDPQSLLTRKSDNRDYIIQGLGESVANIIKDIIAAVSLTDPFQIKEYLSSAIRKGDFNYVQLLTNSIQEYLRYFNIILSADFYDIIHSTSIIENQAEYMALISDRTDFTDEDISYIREIAENCMGKSISLDRDENKRLLIKLDDKDFLNKEKNELPLSTGEQNFLSLTFEMLRAKNSPCRIVIVDDPISSFDSIYKNKIVFALIHILNEKQRLVLTHNIDVLRLMEAQFPKSFSLYLFNNTFEGMNGFIKLSAKERDMVINIEKLLGGLKENVLNYIQEPELFLISMIPFCRGYAMIQNDCDSKDALTNVMHGYKTETVDIALIYRKLFKIDNENTDIPQHLERSVESIMGINIEGKDILARDEYELLNKTLKHTFTYLFLRLLVEKTLVEKFDLRLTGTETLGMIIDRALPRDSSLEIKRIRVRLNSKKVLVNEFNHFEGNMSIFQPAIDISDEVLSKEKSSIIAIMEEIKRL